MEKIDFRSAIARQPQMLADARPHVNDAIARALEGMEPPRAPMLTGIGASHYATLAALPYWHRLGIPAQCVSSGELYHADPRVADLVIAVSASGRSVEPITVLDRLSSARTIGVACEPENPLTTHVDAMVASHCSVDSSPNTASFLGTLQVLGMLAEALSESEGHWEGQEKALNLVLDTSRAPVEQAVTALKDKQVIDCVGNGTEYGVAGYGALLLREFARLPAQSWATHNFLHGPMESNDPTTAAIVFGDGREVDLARDMAEFGITTLLLTARTDLAPAPGFHPIPLPKTEHPVVRAMATSMAIQLLVVSLAQDRGFTSCVFRYRQNDTKVSI